MEQISDYTISFCVRGDTELVTIDLTPEFTSDVSLIGEGCEMRNGNLRLHCVNEQLVEVVNIPYFHQLRIQSSKVLIEYCSEHSFRFGGIPMPNVDFDKSFFRKDLKLVG